MYSTDIYFNTNNNDYLSRHPEIERFYMPKTFYFRYLPDRLIIHWAIIKQCDNCVNVYFINNYGRVFDKLEFKNIKIARRRLRKCGFDFSTNRFCPSIPREPIYIQLCCGKKSAPYSIGNLFQKVQRDGKHPDKYAKSYYKGIKTFQKNNYKWTKKYKSRKNKTNIQREYISTTKPTDYDFKKLLISLILFIITILILKIFM